MSSLIVPPVFASAIGACGAYENSAPDCFSACVAGVLTRCDGGVAYAIPSDRIGVPELEIETTQKILRTLLGTRKVDEVVIADEGCEVSAKDFLGALPDTRLRGPFEIALTETSLTSLGLTGHKKLILKKDAFPVPAYRDVSVQYEIAPSFTAGIAVISTESLPHKFDRTLTVESGCSVRIREAVSLPVVKSRLRFDTPAESDFTRDGGVIGTSPERSVELQDDRFPVAEVNALTLRKPGSYSFRAEIQSEMNRIYATFAEKNPSLDLHLGKFPFRAWITDQGWTWAYAGPSPDFGDFSPKISVAENQTPQRFASPFYDVQWNADGSVHLGADLPTADICVTVAAKVSGFAPVAESTALYFCRHAPAPFLQVRVQVRGVAGTGVVVAANSGKPAAGVLRAATALDGVKSEDTLVDELRDPTGKVRNRGFFGPNTQWSYSSWATRWEFFQHGHGFYYGIPDTVPASVRGAAPERLGRAATLRMSSHYREPEKCALPEPTYYYVRMRMERGRFRLNLIDRDYVATYRVKFSRDLREFLDPRSPPQYEFDCLYEQRH